MAHPIEAGGSSFFSPPELLKTPWKTRLSILGTMVDDPYKDEGWPRHIFSKGGVHAYLSKDGSTRYELRMDGDRPVLTTWRTQGPGNSWDYTPQDGWKMLKGGGVEGGGSVGGIRASQRTFDPDDGSFQEHYGELSLPSMGISRSKGAGEPWDSSLNLTVFNVEVGNTRTFSPEVRSDGSVTQWGGTVSGQIGLGATWDPKTLKWKVSKPGGDVDVEYRDLSDFTPFLNSKEWFEVRREALLKQRKELMNSLHSTGMNNDGAKSVLDRVKKIDSEIKELNALIDLNPAVDQLKKSVDQLKSNLLL